MTTVRILLYILSLFHIIPILLNHLLLRQFLAADDRPLDKGINWLELEGINIGMSVVATSISFLIVFKEQPIAIIKQFILFTFSNQDLGRLSCSIVITLLADGFLLFCVWVLISIRFGMPIPMVGRSSVLLLLVCPLIPMIFGVFYAKKGVAQLSITEICRKTVDKNIKTANKGTNGLFDESGDSYIVIANEGLISNETAGLYLSDNKKDLRQVALKREKLMPGEAITCIVPDDARLHISTSGNTTLYLSDSSGLVLDSVDVSGLANGEIQKKTASGWEVVIEDAVTAEIIKPDVPVFSVQSGFYETSFNVTIAYEEGQQVFYTLDGSLPTKDSAEYKSGEEILIDDKSLEENRYRSIKNVSQTYLQQWEEPENVDKANVLRAIAIDSDGNTSEVATATYFVGLDQYKAKTVVALTADPDALFGENGIYIAGSQYQEWYEKNLEKIQNSEEDLVIVDEHTFSTDPDSLWSDAPVPNYQKHGKDWEREANVEIMNQEGYYLNQKCGIRIQGGKWTRDNPLKRFSLFARKEYSGSRLFDSNLLGNKPVHSLALRDGDRNVICQAIMKDRGLAICDAIPVAVFLNGEYWYDSFLTEKLSEETIANDFQLFEKNIQLIKIGDYQNLEKEDQDVWDSIRNSIIMPDLSDDEKYDKLCESIDMQSFIDCWCSNIYFNNTDMSELKNTAVWKAYVPENNSYSDGKWRWGLYDLDNNGSVFLKEQKVDTTSKINIFKIFKQREDVFRIYYSLKENPDFCKQFVSTFMDLINTSFSQEHLNEILTEYSLDLSYDHYFFRDREQYIVPYLADEFGLTGSLEQVTLTSNISGNHIMINSVKPYADENGWTGKYYTDYPITVSTKGTNFSHWEITYQDETIKLNEATAEVPIRKGGVRIHAVYQ